MPGSDSNKNKNENDKSKEERMEFREYYFDCKDSDKDEMEQLLLKWQDADEEDAITLNDYVTGHWVNCKQCVPRHVHNIIHFIHNMVPSHLGLQY